MKRAIFHVMNGQIFPFMLIYIKMSGLYFAKDLLCEYAA